MEACNDCGKYTWDLYYKPRRTVQTIYGKVYLRRIKRPELRICKVCNDTATAKVKELSGAFTSDVLRDEDGREILPVAHTFLSDMRRVEGFVKLAEKTNSTFYHWYIPKARNGKIPYYSNKPRPKTDRRHCCD